MKDFFELPAGKDGMTMGRMQEIEEAEKDGAPLDLSPEEQAEYDDAKEGLRRVMKGITSVVPTPDLFAGKDLLGSQLKGMVIRDQVKIPTVDMSHLDDIAQQKREERERSRLQTEALLWLKSNGENASQLEAKRDRRDFGMNLAILVISALALVAAVLSLLK